MDDAGRELFARSLRHATDHCRGDALDDALAELGWHDALAVDPRAAVSILFEVQGAANVASSALEDVLRSTLGLVHLSAAGVVLPALGQWGPPGEFDGPRLRVGGLGTAALARRDVAVVVSRTGDKEVAVVVPTADLAVRPVEGLDPWLGLVEVSGETVPVTLDGEPATAEWASAVALGQLAVGYELVGASRKMLELARQHALARIQFGRPISSFQAVRHRLADTLVAIEMADAVLAAVWDDQAPQAAAMAKAIAGRAARTAARHCQQVLAGIGFTTEHPLHRYVRRVLVLDQVLGSAQSLTGELGVELLRTRQLPPLLPL